MGLAQVLGRGVQVEAGQPLAIVHARSEDAALAAAAVVRQAYVLGPQVFTLTPLFAWYRPSGTSP